MQENTSTSTPPPSSLLSNPQNILLGQSIQSYAYRITSSTKYACQLHPLVDFVVYDPAQNSGKLLSEWITESIISEIVGHCSKAMEEQLYEKEASTEAQAECDYEIKIELQVYNMIDREI